MGILSLPDQTIPESQKDEKWHIDHALDYVTNVRSEHYQSQREEILKLYRAYNAELNEKERKATQSVTHPHGHDLGIPYVVYPLIQTKIEQLVGEYYNRPLRRSAYVLDKQSRDHKFQKKLDLITEEIMREYVEQMQEQIGFAPQTANPEMQLPENVEEFTESDFKMLVEQVATDMTSFFLDVRKEKQKLPELFQDYCISDRAHAILDKKYGHTTIRKVHPLDATSDLDPYQTVQDNHEYFFENYWLTENEIYNTFSLNATQKAGVKKIFEAKGNWSSLQDDHDDLSMTNKYDGWYETSNKIGRIRVVSVVWKSRKRVSIKVSENKRGDKLYKKLSEKRQPRASEKVENIDGEIPRHVVMLGPEICLSWGEMDQRLATNEDPFNCLLNVISIYRENPTGSSIIKSPAAKLLQLQEMASEILFEIRLAMKRAGSSRVLVYDSAQTPKEFTKTGYESGLNKVMHHIKRDQLMVINSAQKGSKNSFNQFTSLDLSQKGAIQDLFNGLAIIEDLASKFVGITPEREGDIGQYQTATGADRAIRGSSARTEIFYRPFDNFVQALLERAILKMQHDYEENETLHYVFGNMKAKFITLMKDFFLADFGVHLSDSSKDYQAAQRIEAAAEMALTTANSPEMIMGLIDVFEGDTASEKKATFQRTLNSMEKMRQEAMKAQQEAQQAEMQDRQATRDQDMLKSRESNETEKEVAKIYANNKSFSDRLKTNSAEKIKAAELWQKQQERFNSQKSKSETAKKD